MDRFPEARVLLWDEKYGDEVWLDGRRPHPTAQCYEKLDELLTYFDTQNERIWEVAPENDCGIVLLSTANKEGIVLRRLEQHKGTFRGERSKRRPVRCCAATALVHGAILVNCLGTFPELSLFPLSL